MSIAMYTYLQQTLPRVLTHHTQVAKTKWKLQIRFSPTKENRVLVRRFLSCGVEVKIGTKKKTPVTKCSVYCICVLFSVAKFMERMGIFVFVDVAFYSFALSAAKVPLGQCSRVSFLLSSKIAKADVVVVELVKQKTSEFI